MVNYAYVDLLREDYPYNEAIDDLISFFEEQITNKEELKKMLDLLEDSRRKHYLPMRYINVEFGKYLKNNPKDSKPLSKQENEMLGDLMHFWG